MKNSENLKVKEYLDIKLHDKSIGKILLFNDSNSFFTFNEEYILDKNKNPLSLSFYNNKEDFENGILKDKSDYERIYINILQNYFSNLLPEGNLRDFLCQKYNIKTVREYDLLKQLGNDLSGAVTTDFHSLDKPISFKHKKDILDILSNDNINQQNDEIKPFSLSGYQLKFSLTKDFEKNRFTLPISNSHSGDYILKLPSLDYENVPENEFSFMYLSKLSGIDIPDFSLVKLEQINNLPLKIYNNSDRAFVIKRFDRNFIDGKMEKYHIEDFCQILNIRALNKYDGNISVILKTIKDFSFQPEKDIEEFFKRMTVCVLMGNGDMHFKNWSFIYNNGKPKLSPAYDILSTIPYIKNEKFALNINKGKRLFIDFNYKTINKICNFLDIPFFEIKNIVDETKEIFLQNWNKEKTNLYLSNNIIEMVDKHQKNLDFNFNSSSIISTISNKIDDKLIGKNVSKSLNL